MNSRTADVLKTTLPILGALIVASLTAVFALKQARERHDSELGSRALMDAGRALAEMQVIADLRAEVHFALFNTIVGGVRAKLAETGFFGNELDQMSAALFTRLVDARIAERQARVVAAAYVRSEAAIHEFTEFLRHLKVVLAGPESVTPILPEQLEMYDLAVRAVVALRHDDGRNAVAHRDIRQLLFDCEGPTTVGHA